jgi:hypothetical protein
MLFGVTILQAQNSAEQAQRVQEMRQIMGNMQEQIRANPNMTPEEQKALMMKMMNQSQTIQSMLQKQQVQMPKVLEVLKSNRACIAKADTKSDAKACEKESEKLAKKLGLEEDFDDEGEEDFVWNEEEKRRALANMDEGISHIERSLPCIKKAKTMSDMAQCSQRR